MKKTLLSVIMLLPMAAFSQSITGKITQTGNTVSYAEVVAVKDQKKQTAISDEKGNYSLKLFENGKYTVKLIYDGEELSTVDIVVKGDVKQDFFIEKKRKNRLKELPLLPEKNLLREKPTV